MAVGAVESDDHDGVGIRAAFHDGVLVQCEILVHAHAGHVFEHRRSSVSNGPIIDSMTTGMTTSGKSVRSGWVSKIPSMSFTSHHERQTLHTSVFD